MEKRNVPTSVLKLVQGQIQSKIYSHKIKLNEIDKLEEKLESEKRQAKEMAQNLIDEIKFLRMNGDDYDYFSQQAMTEKSFIEQNQLQ